MVDVKAAAVSGGDLLLLALLHDPVNLPSAAAFSPDGDSLYVANAGTNNLSIIPLGGSGGPGLVEVGARPLGVAVAPNGLVYVHDSLHHDIAIVDPVRAAVVRRITIALSPLSAEVQRGKELFFAADREDLAQEGWISCAGCHLEARVDGRTWQFSQGSRQTTPIQGLADTAPYHWSGERPDLASFDLTVQAVNFGTGLSEADLEDLGAFLVSDAFPPSPFDPDEPAARRGGGVFARAGCAECHAGPALIDRLAHDVGTGDGPDEALGPVFDTPTLRGIWDTAPYLHDGRAADLVGVFRDHNPGDGHGVTSGLSPQDLADLAAYFRSL